MAWTNTVVRKEMTHSSHGSLNWFLSCSSVCSRNSSWLVGKAVWIVMSLSARSISASFTSGRGWSSSLTPLVQFLGLTVRFGFRFYYFSIISHRWFISFSSSEQDPVQSFSIKPSYIGSLIYSILITGQASTRHRQSERIHEVNPSWSAG